MEMCVSAVLHAACDSYLHGPARPIRCEGNGCYGNMAAILQQMQGAFDGVLVPKFV